MINITNKKDCCGCNACGDICPQQAIAFKTDMEGFWYPEVDAEKCNDCGACERACPITNAAELKKNDLEQSVCYAAEHKNLEVVFDSTSGGLFSALADVMYKEGGSVGGAVFNDDFSVRHFISGDKKDLPRLRSSKYLQSSLAGFYREVKDLLKNDARVLVCGCPCQMAALRSFLAKDYGNLIIADFICRGVNSPKVWRKYLDSFEERYGSPVAYAKAKSKEYGWRNLTQKVVLENGKSYYETGDESLYTIGYLRTNVYCRPSCYDCRFKGFPRIADITLADFWGIEKFSKSIDKNLGTSLAMVNSSKGAAYFEGVKARINYIEAPFESILKGNPALAKPLDPPTIDRKLFFEDLDATSFIETAKKYFPPKKSLKRTAKKFLGTGLAILKDTKMHFVPVAQMLRHNHYLKCFGAFWEGRGLVPSRHCVIEIGRDARIAINGIFRLGAKKLGSSKLETRLLVENGGALHVENDLLIMYGADIEVFNGGTLRFGGGSGSNINCTIICADKIEIGKNVMIGRNVTIRDNNGGHYLNRQGYRDSRPVLIGDKAWLCEGCTIMPGAHIGEGAIVGAHAFVTGNVPAHALVSGNPARIVDEDVLWKY